MREQDRVVQVFESGNRAEGVEASRSDDSVVDDRAPAGGQPARRCSGSVDDHLVLVMGPRLSKGRYGPG